MSLEVSPETFIFWFLPHLNSYPIAFCFFLFMLCLCFGSSSLFIILHSIWTRVNICTCKIDFTLLLLNTTCPILANSVDPDQLASDLDMHCLSLNKWISIKKSDQVIWLAGSGRGILIYSARQGLNLPVVFTTDRFNDKCCLILPTLKVI